MNIESLAKVSGVETDRFAEMLRPFPIDPGGVTWASVKSAKGQPCRVSVTEPEMMKSVRMLRPKTLEDVRRWVGMPPSVMNPKAGTAAKLSGLGEVFAAARQRTHALTDKDRHWGASPHAVMEDLQQADRLRLQRASENLVFGCVSPEELKTPLYSAARRRLLDIAFPTIFVLNIHVARSSVLEIDSSISTLVAGRITIEQGGRIRVGGRLSVHCAQLESNN